MLIIWAIDDNREINLPKALHFDKTQFFLHFKFNIASILFVFFFYLYFSKYQSVQSALERAPNPTLVVIGDGMAVKPVVQFNRKTLWIWI